MILQPSLPVFIRCIPNILFFLIYMNLAWPQIPDSFPISTPESQGLSSASLQALADIIQESLDEDNIVGAEFLVIKNRRTVFHEAFGWRDWEDQVRMERNTIFNIRSMTKPLTGAAIQILMDEGKVHLSDTAAKFIPGFNNPKSSGITVEQLLTHRSGLPLSIIEGLNDYNSLFDMANAIGERGPQFTPSSKFWYSDAGTEVLGAIVEKVSGQLLDQFVQARLLEPLGMSDTLVPLKVTDPHWDRMASLYYGSKGDWTKIWKPNRAPFYPFAWGSQSLFSTPMDYAHFLAMWMDGGIAKDRQILSPEAIIRTLTPASVMSSLGTDTPMPTGFFGQKMFYGQMAILYAESKTPVGAQPLIIGHSGSDGTWAWAWPQLDLMVLYFTQSRGNVTGVRLETFLDTLLIYPERDTNVPEKYKPYIGTYDAATSPLGSGKYTILYSNGRLALDIPNQIVFELKEPDALGNWRFVLYNNVSVAFDQDTDGLVTAMRFNYSGSIFTFEKMIPTPIMDWRQLD